jgi:hypothetical protein
MSSTTISPLRTRTWSKGSRSGEIATFSGNVSDNEIRKYVETTHPNHWGYKVERVPEHFVLGMDQWVPAETMLIVTTFMD